MQGDEIRTRDNCRSVGYVLLSIVVLVVISKMAHNQGSTLYIIAKIHIFAEDGAALLTAHNRFMRTRPFVSLCFAGSYGRATFPAAETPC